MRPGLILLAAVGASAASTLVLAPVAVRWLRARDVIDNPNHRSSHTRPVVRGAGVAMVPTAAGASLALAPSTWPLVVVAVVLASVGLVDDLQPRSALLRFGLQGAAGVGLGIWVLDTRSVAVAVLVVVFCCGYVNAVNFMDGINGITGLHAFVVGLTFGYLGWDLESPALAAAGGALAGAGVGFLPVNFPTAKAFPGDAGSYLVGGWIAGLVALGVHEGLDLVVVGGAAVIYIADTTWTMVRRASRGEKITEPHRQHAYQRLVDAGHSNVVIAVMVAAFTAVTAGVGVAADRSAGLTLVLPVVAGCYLILPFLDERRAARATLSRMS